MTALRWIANVLGWPAIQLAVSFLILRIPDSLFARDTWLTIPRSWEDGGRLYRRLFFLQRWKRLLPDGASWLGGFAKKRFSRRDIEYINRFLLETRRAEWAHWAMLCCLPAFFLWNPWWARLVMTAYAAVANLPCILVQRYNRIVLSRMAGRQRHAVVNR